jgi:hypothetical protein
MSIISGGLSLLTGGASFLSGAKYWLIGCGIACVIAFGAGYYKATSMAEDKLITATASAYANGTAAQKKKDDGDYKVALADAIKRKGLDDARHVRIQTIIERLPALVPAKTECTISADAMKALNEVVAPK